MIFRLTGPVLAIVEFCCHGNLLDFLRSKRKYFSESPEGTGSQSHTGHSSSTGASNTFQTSSGSERRMKAVYDQVRNAHILKVWIKKHQSETTLVTNCKENLLACTQ